MIPSLIQPNTKLAWAENQNAIPACIEYPNTDPFLQCWTPHLSTILLVLISQLHVLMGGSCHDSASAALWQKTEVPKLFTGWLSLGHLFFMNLSSAHWKNSGGGGDYQPHSSGPSWESAEVHMANVFCKMRRTVQTRLRSKDVIGFSWFCQLQRWLTNRVFCL